LVRGIKANHFPWGFKGEGGVMEKHCEVCGEPHKDCIYCIRAVPNKYVCPTCCSECDHYKLECCQSLEGFNIKSLRAQLATAEAQLADICKRLRGVPGPDGSKLDGEDGLAAATMRSWDMLNESNTRLLEERNELRKELAHEIDQGSWMNHELTELRKGVAEAVEAFSEIEHLPHDKYCGLFHGLTSCNCSIAKFIKAEYTLAKLGDPQSRG